MKKFLLTLFLCGCPSAPSDGDVDWSLVHAEVIAISGDPSIPGDRGDLGDLADLIATASASSAADWETFRTALQGVNTAIGLRVDTGEDADLGAAVSAALDAAEALVAGVDDPSTKIQVQAGLFVARAVLRRVRAHAQG